MQVSNEDLDVLTKLEESLWVDETRFNKEYMESILASDFFEFGRSGRIYEREHTINVSRESINAKLPLKNFAVQGVTKEVFLVTYVSEVQYGELELANRSSLWVKTADGFKLKFHQGTAVKN